MKTFRNPILSGCYPDPSICRVGDDFYLVNSTFAYFPGLPIFHSRDLVHWRQIGHAFDRPSQLDLHEIHPACGLYAPTIRYWQGVFYIINTLVAGKGPSGNFIITATNPAGPWSEPHWLEAEGIDPSLFFDDDGRVWYVGNRGVANPQYEGHTEIWLQELDLPSMRLIGESMAIWEGALKKVIWPESPHIYRIGEFYYLMIAEGGTEYHHAVTIARSESIQGPYQGNPGNPILTHRHLGHDYPIVGTGHADLVQTGAGDWWMVLLAMRPYDGYFYNLGRETFLVPVSWEDGWPIVSPGIGRVEFSYPVPNLPEQTWPEPAARDDFDAPTLGLCWNLLRTPPATPFYSLSECPGSLRLYLRPEHVAEQSNPSFVGRRQQHINFVARTALTFSPLVENECVGLVAIQNEDFHFRFVVTAQTVRLTQRAHKEETILAEQPLAAGQVWLKIEAHGQNYGFYFSTDLDTWHPLAENVDGRILSTPVAGGFVGAWIAMYASSNGQPSSNYADFDWFEYHGLDEEN
jgi:alpha-N-arabinofuranosidase